MPRRKPPQSWYITFGVKYAHEPHPALPPEIAHPEAIVEIVAPTEIMARRLAFGLTADLEQDNPIGHYCSIYPMPEPSSQEWADLMGIFPRGVTALLAWEQS